VPALMVLFVRGRIVPEHKNPINRFLIWVYRPLIRGVLKAKTLTILLALVALAVSLWPARQLGTEFMPSLNEGTLMYMPTTLPGLSVTKAAEILQTQNRIIKTFPEVASVYGKAGRAETATDPAPTEMFETIVNLKPKEQWRPGDDGRRPDRRSGQGAAVSRRLERLDHADQGPYRHAGDRHPHADRHQGAGDRPGRDGEARPQIETVVKAVPGTSSAYAERVIGGYYLDVVPDREALARYGLMISDVQDTVIVGPGWRDHHHDRRRPRALRRQSALPARSAQRSPVDRPRRAGGDAGRGHRPLGRGRQAIS
jgi:copper/silver efflux system protein